MATLQRASWEPIVCIHYIDTSVLTMYPSIQVRTYMQSPSHSPPENPACSLATGTLTVTLPPRPRIQTQ